MSLRNKRSGKPRIGGRHEPGCIKMHGSDGECTFAPAAKDYSKEKNAESITLNLLYECKVCENVWENLQVDSSSGKAVCPSCVKNVTEKSPNEKIASAEGEAMSNVGLKHDQDKPALAYIPKAALWAEGQAFSYGAKKYEAWNYKYGINVTRTLSAAIRHIVQFLAGVEIDVESGVHHLGCARANIAMALDTLENHPEYDDRFKGEKK